MVTGRRGIVTDRRRMVTECHDGRLGSDRYRGRHGCHDPYSLTFKRNFDSTDKTKVRNKQERFRQEQLQRQIDREKKRTRERYDKEILETRRQLWSVRAYRHVSQQYSFRKTQARQQENMECGSKVKKNRHTRMEEVPGRRWSEVQGPDNEDQSVITRSNRQTESDNRSLTDSASDVTDSERQTTRGVISRDDALHETDEFRARPSSPRLVLLPQPPTGSTKSSSAIDLIKNKVQVVQHSSRVAIFPAQCRTGYALRRFIRSEVDRLLTTDTPETVRRRRVRRILDNYSCPELVHQNRSTTAIFRNYRAYRSNHSTSELCLVSHTYYL